MTGDEFLKLDTLNDSAIKTICVDQCQGKCCNFRSNDYTVRVSTSDFSRLVEKGLDQFVTFQGEVGKVELMPAVDGTCIFLDPGSSACTIHEIKPRQCRMYPFQSGWEELPDWCLLYHGVTERLREKLSQEKIKTIDLSEHNDSDDLYQRRTDQGDLHVKRQIASQFSLTGSNEYWNIYLADLDETKAEILREVKTKIASYKNECKQDWQIYSVRVYNSDLQFRYQLNGLYRNDYTVSVPYIESFPPEPANLLHLFDAIRETVEWKDYFIAGIDLPEEAYDTIRTLVKE